MSSSGSDPPSFGMVPVRELVERAREGDEAAFQILFQMFYLLLWKYLRRLIGNGDDAADLVQLTFLKAWNELPALRDSDLFRQWLYQIATRNALDHFRKQEAEQRLLVRLGERGPREPMRISLEERVEERELIERALKQIPERMRTCLLLQHEGFSTREVAEILGLSKKSVSTYLCEARRQFIQTYQRMANEQQ